MHSLVCIAPLSMRIINHYALTFSTCEVLQNLVLCCTVLLSYLFSHFSCEYPYESQNMEGSITLWYHLTKYNEQYTYETHIWDLLQVRKRWTWLGVSCPSSSLYAEPPARALCSPAGDEQAPERASRASETVAISRHLTGRLRPI